MKNRHAARPLPHVLVYARLAIVVPLLAACFAGAPANVPAVQVQPTTPAPVPTIQQTPDPTVQPAAQPTNLPTAQPSPAITLAPRPTPTPTAVPTPVALDPKPAPGKFIMDIGEPKAFVRQVTTAMCVPASMQIMINLMADAAPDHSRETQKSLYELARSYSPWITSDRDGAAANGWAAGLDHLGFGHFQPMSIGSFNEAVNVAARQMRFTGKPVGLIVWAGDHAWVMSGFKATADPAWTDDFDVTAVWVEDPWFGRTDRTWGAGLAPHTLVSTADLAADFVGWPSRYFMGVYGSADRYVIVAPQS